jgi:hypothetical protein
LSRHSPCLSRPVADLHRNLRQALRSEDNQTEAEQDEKFPEADVEHAGSGCVVSVGLVIFRVLLGEFRIGFVEFLGLGAFTGLDVGICIVHRLAKTLDGAAQVTADTTEFLGAENHDNDQQNDQQLPQAYSA